MVNGRRRLSPRSIASPREVISRSAYGRIWRLRAFRRAGGGRFLFRRVRFCLFYARGDVIDAVRARDVPILIGDGGDGRGDGCVALRFRFDANVAPVASKGCGMRRGVGGCFGGQVRFLSGSERWRVRSDMSGSIEERSFDCVARPHKSRERQRRAQLRSG